MGLVGGGGSPSLRQDQFVQVMGGDTLNGEYLDNLVGVLAGDGSGGGKTEGEGLIIAATLFFHEHAICLQRIVVRQGRTKKKRSDKAIPAATNSDNPSWICPLPPGGEGGWRGDPACYFRAGQSPRTADMCGMFSAAQTPLTTYPTTSALSEVPWPVAKFSKPTLPRNAWVGTTKTTTDNILVYNKVQ